MNTQSTSPLAKVIAQIPWKAIFQRVPGIWLLFLFPFAFVGPVYAPALFGLYYTILHVMFLFNNLRSAYGMYISYNSAKLYSVTNWLKKYCDETGTVDGLDNRHDLPYDHVVHVILLPNYKENMDTLCETLDVLASHTRAVTQYKVCLAMEETEKDCELKAHELMKLYADSFFDITYTVHPAGRANEIRGKSSNVAWAASEMARRSGGGIHGRHEHEIVTVMDADTAFAEDYFAAVTYHYCVASPEQRRIMMFAPCTVFDRNAKDVPVFVRVTDIFWSIGVMSNLYASSPVKIPCSAYSVSMELAISVNFWDAGPEAIGEDLHMYLKCFFATNGKVIVKPIFSPASCANVEGSGEGISGWISGLRARYTQAKRHLWGSLDTGYAMRRAILSFAAPDLEPRIQLRNTTNDKDKSEKKSTYGYYALIILLYRLLETHILMGHLFLLISTSAIILPVRSAVSYKLSAYLWSFISSDPVHPYVELALNVSFWVRFTVIVPNIIMIWYYEKYHRYVGFERWALQDAQRKEQQSIYPGKRVDAKDAGDSQELAIARAVVQGHIAPSHAHLRVQHLGKRCSLESAREYPRNLFDWLTIPVAGFLFYVAPQFHAQLAHIFTNSLEYKVAAKPMLHRPQTEPLINITTVKDEKVDLEDTKSVSSKGDEGFFEEFEEDKFPFTESRSASRVNLAGIA
ncbi:hypothetical protein HK098_000570 [Nowakowskiella sp. JEL0407]|nr:hypothetical protein HK098_000570 [Nowakowskiella sp. JEL0407]